MEVTPTVSERAHELLSDAANREAGNNMEISVRELLTYWGARRRGLLIVEQIQQDLAAHGLTTHPPFTEGWIDNTVTLLPVRRRESGRDRYDAEISSQERTESTLPQVSLLVGNLESANRTVCSVTPDDSLERAQTLMMCNDYSQLAVLSGPRNLRGAVSWESIAQARIRDPQARLQDSITTSEVVQSNDDLLAQVPKIADAGFVFVQGLDRILTGIVTTADLSYQFLGQAKPFFVIAEIERRLRRIIDRIFSPEELAEIADPADTKRVIQSADNLSIGEYVRLLENPERWSRLPWQLDRKAFVETLKRVGATRNEVLHFSPDPQDPEDIAQMENFVKLLKRLDPEP